MAYLFASGTPHVLVVLGISIVLIVRHIVVLVILRLVLAELAAWLVLALLAAAPPHLAAIVTLVLPTAPVEILTLTVLLITVLARLEAAVKLALALDELLNADLGLFLFQSQLFTGLFKGQDLV